MCDSVLTETETETETERSALSVWSTAYGKRWGNEPPGISEPVLELTLQPSSDFHTKSGSHPAHEAAMRSPLPPTLRILRLDYCRIRTFPLYLPAGILELYAQGCDFFTLPDLSAHTQLIVLELQDNRIEHLSSPLPRTLARFNIRRNALQRVAFPPLVTKPDTLASIEIAHNPGIEEVRDTENRTYQHLVRNAQRDFHPTPTRPSSAIPEWVRTSLWERPPMNARNDNEFSEGGDRAWNGSVINPTNRRVTVPTSRRVTEPMLNRPMGGGPVHTPPADNIYTNTQSVHDAGIQDSARQNLSYIHMYSPETPVQSMAAILASIQTYVSLTYYNGMSTWERILSTITFHFGSNTASVVNEVRTRTQGIGNDYVIHGYTPSAIVERLWTRILAERSPDLIMRFSEEVLSARNMCTNGFMTRMANVLVCFDPAVVMRVTPEKVL